MAEGFDACIHNTGNLPQDMVMVRCTGDIRFLVVGAPSYFEDREKPLVPEDLLRHTCIHSRLPSGSWYRWEFGKRGEERRIDVDGPLGLDSHRIMIAAALDGLGLIWTSESSVRAFIDLVRERTP